ncbi:MAG: hypothetical protein ABJF23_05765 [Bryobacteraceae bacterium]
MPLDTDIFALIDRVNHLPVLNGNSVRQIFQSPLQQVADTGNPYIKILTADVDEASAVQHLELRIPVESAPSSQALLILTLRAGRGVPIDEVRRRYGVAARVEMPRAEAPTGTPTYEIYEFPWGRLNFGYRTIDNQLREVIFDKK